MPAEVGTMSGLKVGDVVRLKSGGQKMTVTFTGGTHMDGSVRCVWHDGEGKVHREWFPEEAIAVVHRGPLDIAVEAADKAAAAVDKRFG